MAVGFYNNWDNVLNKLQSLLRVEFGNSLTIYKDIRNIAKDMKYVIIKPISSGLVEYFISRERREFGINIVLYFKQSTIKQTDIDQIMRLVSRIETVIANNSSMTLSDGTDAYDCRIESTEIDNENADEYIVTMDFRCIHTNDISSDTTAPTMTITATQVVDGATSYHTTLAMTFTSSENTTDFTVTDITLGNAVLSSFSATSGTVYTATLTPSAAGAVTVDVNAERYIDNAGNPNTAATQFNWTYAINTYSLEFDGNNDYVQIDADPLGTNYNACTYSAWIKTDSTADGTIINRTSNTSNAALLSFKILGNGKPWMNVDYPGGGDTTANTAVNNGAWRHIVWVQDGTTRRIYIDGNEDLEETGGEVFAPEAEKDTDKIYIGMDKRQTTAVDSFDGKIDEVAVWNVVLDGDDIEKLYEDEKPTYLTNATAYNADRTGNLVGYWRMEENTGSEVADSSTNSNEGTITGASWSSDVPS
tara:strand:- start:243 stop:1670 length:1428 start_codon:yes stop_codon:yes gene_type:complete